MLFAIAANGEIVRECERRLRVMDAVIKYLTVRLDDEIRRLDKIKRIGRNVRHAADRARWRQREQSIEEPCSRVRIRRGLLQ